MNDRLEALEKENQQLKADLERIKHISEQKTKRKKGFLKFIGHSLAGKRLKKSIYRVLDQYNTKRFVTRDALSDLLASILYRLTRIGVFTIFFALLPSILLIQQNMLLKQQNKKIQDQNYLAEASRRSGQMFIMGDVFSDINSETKQGNSNLSATLTGRIASLSRAMKPYRYFENGKLIKIPMSPERGQLLITLSKSKINKTQLSDEVFQNSDFTCAVLSEANLSNAYLRDINLENADLSNADLVSADLSYTILRNTNLYNVDLTDAKLRLADLSNANLSEANLMYAKLSKANLSNTNLDRVKVHRMDWLDYIKNNLKLKGAQLLFDNYKIDSLYAQDLGRKVPTLVRK